MKAVAAKAFLFFSLFIPPLVPAQDTLHLVIVSPRVGELIDRDERDQFKLFSHVDGFRSAVFYQTPQGEFFARIVSQKAGGREVTSTFRYDERQLVQLSERIDHYEALQEKRYQFGSEPASIQIVGVGPLQKPSSAPIAFDSSRTHFFQIVSQTPVISDRLPLAQAPWPGRIYPTYPRVSLSVGLRGGYVPEFTTPEAQNLNRLFSGSGNGLEIEIGLEFSRIVSLAFGGGSLSGNIARVYSIAGLVRLRAPFASQIVPYAGIGITRVHASGDDRDQNIQFDTGDTGSIFEVGAEFAPAFGTSITAYYRRFIMDIVSGDYVTLQRGTIPVNLDLNGGTLGLRVNLYY